MNLSTVPFYSISLRCFFVRRLASRVYSIICMHSMQPSTKRNETKRPSLFLSSSPSLHYSLAIFTGEGGESPRWRPARRRRRRRDITFHCLFTSFYLFTVLYHRVLYPLSLPFPPSPVPLEEYHTCLPIQLPGPKLTHVLPSIHTGILFTRSHARLRRRRGDHMVFISFSFFYIYLLIYPFTLSLALFFFVMSLLEVEVRVCDG